MTVAAFGQGGSHGRLLGVDGDVFSTPRPGDEGMTNGPLIFANLVFGPGGITVEGIAKPIKTRPDAAQEQHLAYKQGFEESKLD
jgi:hypothetical protein